MSLLPMFVKEFKELARSYRLLFVPVVFGILGLGQPVAVKLMPQLLKSASNLPEGTVIQIPEPDAWMVIAGAFDQFNQLGILVLIMAAMGAVSAERVSGVAATVLAKPVSRGSFLLSKMLSYSLLAAVSLGVGVGLAAYYTQVLLKPVYWQGVVTAVILYLPNLVLVIAITLCFSSFLPSPLSAGGASITTVLVLNLAPRYLGDFLARTSPAALKASGVASLSGVEAALVQPLLGVGVLIAIFLSGGWRMLERQEI